MPTSPKHVDTSSDLDTEVLREMLGRMQRQLDAAAVVSQLESVISGDVERAASQVTELASRATGCERVNAWLFNDDETELHCIDSYQATSGEHSAGMILREPDFRNEFQALKFARFVDADDPLTDPRTAGYIDTYLLPHRITSMLDAVIRVPGRNLGLLCFEHVDRPHHWEKDEIAFACQLADKIALTILSRSRLRSEQRMRESEAALADAQTIANLGSWEYDIRDGILTWSQEMYRIFGVDPSDFTPSLDAALARSHADDRERVEARRKEAISEESPYAMDHRIVRDGGLVRHVHERGRMFRDGAGRPSRLLGTIQDITDRKHEEERLLFVNTLLATQLETSPDAILVVGGDGRISSHNHHFEQMWGLSPELLASADVHPVTEALASQMKDRAGFLARVRFLYEHPEEKGRDELETIDGRWVERLTGALRAPAGQYLGRIWFFRDITDQKRTEAEIRHSATHDGLTGLANRGTFKAAVEHAIARARRTARGFAVLYLDLDHFKDVNDTLGHAAGDELLRTVAARLRGTCRADDVVARFGGDEFAVIAADMSDPADASVLATSILRALAEPFEVQGSDVRTSASIGIATHLDGQSDAEDLLSRADIALYRAKSEGRSVYRFFTDAMDREVRTRVTLEAQLRHAITSNQLFLLYQPQVEAASRHIIGVEALVRWRHPEHGVLQPASFIPIAERSGLIASVSVWVMRESCRRAKAWIDDGLQLNHVAVNLSARQFRAPLELEREVIGVLNVTGLPPNRLELEITETALLEESRERDAVLSRLRARGIRLAIDDFGTGYSSLDYLRRFPVDRIKIPQAFVDQISDVKGTSAIVKATIGLARELGIDVIAEGVSTEEQLVVLKSWGCEQVQGFLFAEPLSGTDVTHALQRRR